MRKYLIFIGAVLLIPASIALVYGQSSNPGQSEGNSLAANGMSGSVRPASSGDKRPVSPAADAEARRLYKIAVRYGRAGLFRQAMETFQKAIELNPDYIDAHYGLGHAYFDLGRWDDAIRSLEQVLRLNPKDAEAEVKLREALAMREKEISSRQKRNRPLTLNAKDKPSSTPVSLNVSQPKKDNSVTKTVSIQPANNKEPASQPKKNNSIPSGLSTQPTNNRQSVSRPKTDNSASNAAATQPAINKESVPQPKKDNSASNAAATQPAINKESVTQPKTDNSVSNAAVTQPAINKESVPQPKTDNSASNAAATQPAIKKESVPQPKTDSSASNASATQPASNKESVSQPKTDSSASNAAATQPASNKEPVPQPKKDDSVTNLVPTQPANNKESASQPKKDNGVANGDGVQPTNNNASAATAPEDTVTTPLTNTPPNEIDLTRIYKVGPGDVLDVRINDAPPGRSTLFTVTPTGLLEHPNFVDPLAVSGLTVEEISARIEADQKRRALNEHPKAIVGVRDYVSHAILVSGLVKDPGTKILRREAIPLYVVVADAQPTAEAGRVIVVRHETNDAVTIDLANPEDMNLLVRPGDVITLHPNVTQFIYVGGEVKSPGEWPFRRGLTLTQALLVAGGVLRDSKEIQLARDNGRGFLVQSKFKLKAINSGQVPDPLIQPGDRITVVH